MSTGTLQQLQSLSAATLARMGLNVAGALALKIMAHVWGWHMTMRSRRRLAHLDDRLLRDIGLTRDQARTELRKPFWEV